MPHVSEISRRRFVAGAGFGAGALILGGVPVGAGAQVKRAPFARKGSFPQGIAAGEPGTRAMTLWTRLAGYNADRRLTVEVARDAAFKNVVYRRNLVARASETGSVKVRIDKGLKPGERYFYRFETLGAHTKVGKFDTLRPADSNEPVRIAYYSCQDWPSGYFGAHQAIAREDVDMVVCLGDYIYEKVYYEGPRKDTLGANHDGEVMTLAEYRQKYQMYKGDKDLQAMHAAHTFMGIWDDHEVEDNYAGDHPGDQADDRRVGFHTRRLNAYRAYFEHMPFRRPVRQGLPLYRTIPLGTHAELILIDSRQYRDDQPCGDQLLVPCPSAEDDPRTLLGPTQKEWLKGKLKASTASWKLIANQVMIMGFDAGPGTPINKDQWDGYGMERKEILGFIRDQGIQDVSFLTGDIHTFFAGDVGVNGRGPDSVATEFVGGSLTSLGIRESINTVFPTPLSAQQFDTLAQSVLAANPHIKYNELDSKGYAVLEATKDQLKVEYKAVDAVNHGTTAKRLASFVVQRGTPRVNVAAS